MMHRARALALNGGEIFHFAAPIFWLGNCVLLNSNWEQIESKLLSDNCPEVGKLWMW